ncbi:alpha/beta hydrolase family protein [Xenophilus sp.]|uniref:alpha/beta hydrolase family protein n=1 Tax=Xenophilus sp. TaxID=1873499 RepID=UPI0037DD9C01
MTQPRRLAFAAALAAAGLALPAAARTAAPSAPRPATCPAAVPADARCYTGADGQGAFYWIAVPKDWNRVLVMHAHGGPETGPPRPQRSEEDLQRWAVTVKAGYAWAGSTYRRGGYGVTMAAEDTERLRRIFVAHFGTPRRTLLHGQSYGAGVAAKAAELYAPAGGVKGPYDGLVLTSGVLGGGNTAYDFRLDLRVVYQYVCRNHPAADEPQYPLWQGLPPDSTLTRKELAERVRACTGVGLPAAQRTPEQAARLKTILTAVRIPERTLVAHLNWGTWLFQDVVQKRLGGRNPFGNVGVTYAAAPEEAAALNAGVARYAADPQAQGALAADSLPTGRTALPTVTLHAIDDPTAFVELEDSYRRIREAAGTADRLVQAFSNERSHSYLSDPEYPALFDAMLDWIDRGEKPTPDSLAQRCAAQVPRFTGESASGCHLQPAWRPQPIEHRVPPRAP